MEKSIKAPQTLAGHSRAVGSVAFSPDGSMLASGSWETTIELWDVRTGGVLRTLAGDQRIVRSIAFSPDGNTIASGSSDKIVRLWDVRTGTELCALAGHSGTVETMLEFKTNILEFKTRFLFTLY